VHTTDRGETLTNATAARVRADRRARWRAVVGGGTDGNEKLTAMTGVILIALLTVIGLTILRIHQLISVHLFVGLLLLGPVSLKVGSTGYRFVRYYTRDQAYRKKGPPELWLRAIAPLVVLSTLAVFASGIVLLFEGPARRGQWVTIHKASFIVWLVFAGLHLLGHLGQLPSSLRASRGANGGSGPSPGAAGRWLALTGALVAGVVIAIFLIPNYALWTAHGAFLHHHH
jgi:hypothetical protein